MNEEFEKWFDEYDADRGLTTDLGSAQAAWNHQQVKIDDQAKEIAKLTKEVRAQSLWRSYWGKRLEDEYKLRAEQAEEIAKLKTEVDVQTYWGKRWEDEHQLRIEQAEELKALRGFANEVYMKEYSPAANEALLNFHLINEYGEPTKLLTGEK